jgi:hypothetical protein
LKCPRFSQMNPVGCKQGMVARVVFLPISVQTLLGHSRQYKLKHYLFAP